MEFILTCLFVVLDQGSKFLMESILKNSISIIPNFFSLKLVYNTGASWSILLDQVYLLIGISIFCLLALQYAKHTISNSTLKKITYALLYGGIVGNLIDRIVFHHVRDFLSFCIFHYDFPIFNIADIEIVVGTAFMIYIIWREENGNGKKNSSRFRRKTKNR